MKTSIALRFVVLMLVLLSVGCASENKGKIEGTNWTSNPGTVKGATLPAGALALDFAADGKLVYTVGPQKLTGTYSLGMGSYVTLNFDQDLAGRKSHTQKISISGDTLTMTDSDGTSLTFSKTKAGKAIQ